MNTHPRKLLGLAAAAAAFAGLGGLSRVGYVAESANDGLVRLAWRTPSTRVRECRHRTAEEMAKLPAHMREGEVCERRTLPYLLTIVLDGSRDSAVVRPAGVQHDRPLYVYREMSVAPGRHHIHVVFERQGTPTEVAPHEETNEPRHGEAGGPARAPARLALDTVITLEDRAVALITYDADTQQLVIR